MKGIAHFASGLCVASFVPGVVTHAAQGGFLIALGGACAMLPDMLDFRFERFIERHDTEITPDAQRPNAQQLADQIANEINLAHTACQPRIIQLHPARRSVIEWVLYSVEFDSARREVVVKIDNTASEARAPLNTNVRYEYDGALHIEELGGPSLKLDPHDDTVRIEFLPWHRLRTHSLVIALALGALCTALWGMTAGIVATLGFAVHVIEDQFGYMGSNLFWPLTRARTQGLRLLHASDGAVNAGVVWLSLTLLLLNLDRARELPLLPLVPYVLFVIVIPTAIFAWLQLQRIWHRRQPELLRNLEAVAEARES